jgi:hypothetical protein
MAKILERIRAWQRRRGESEAEQPAAKTSQEPAREPKAIFVPSGDQSGRTSNTEVFVTFVWSLPSAFMTKMSPMSPLRTPVKAILPPSGDPAEK